MLAARAEIHHCRRGQLPSLLEVFKRGIEDQVECSTTNLADKLRFSCSSSLNEVSSEFRSELQHPERHLVNSLESHIRTNIKEVRRHRTGKASGWGKRCWGEGNCFHRWGLQG